jgi:hypothetical protein
MDDFVRDSVPFPLVIAGLKCMCAPIDSRSRPRSDEGVPHTFVGSTKCTPRLCGNLQDDGRPKDDRDDRNDISCQSGEAVLSFPCRKCRLDLMVITFFLCRIATTLDTSTSRKVYPKTKVFVVVFATIAEAFGCI